MTTEVLFVRASALAFVCLAVGSGVIVWRNAAAPDAVSNIGIALAALLPVCIALFPYLSRETITHSCRIILIFDTQKDRLTFGKLLGPYDLAMSMFFADASKIPAHLLPRTRADFDGEKGMDIVERGIINWLSLNFQNSWDFEIARVKYPQGEGARHKAASDDPGTQVSMDLLSDSIGHNPMLAAPEARIAKAMTFPPNSSIRGSVEVGRRTIRIESDAAVTTIDIRRDLGGTLQNGFPGVLERDPANMDRYWFYSFEVGVELKTRFLQRHAPSMPGHRRWFNSMTSLIDDYSWESISTKLKEQN